MITTNTAVKVIAGTVAGQCLIATSVVAAELQDLTGGGSVEVILAAVSALCIGIIGTTLAGVRWIVKAAKQENTDHQNPLWLLMANQLTRDTDALELLKQVVNKVDRHDTQLKAVLEDYMLRHAEEEGSKDNWEKPIR